MGSQWSELFLACFLERPVPVPLVATRVSLVLLLALLLQVILVAPGEAAKIRFGSRETLHVIAKTNIFNRGEPLSLCYKSYTYYLIAGLYTTDELVLCDVSKDHYLPMPPHDEIEQLQKAKLLPNPLPAYKRPLVDYLIGYSLWICLPFIALLTFFAARREKAQAATDDPLLRDTVRSVMARMIVCSTHSRMTIAIARETYMRMFNEPIPEDALAADVNWVRNEPAAYDGFIGAAGRKFPKPVRLSLLRLAAGLVMVRGELQPDEQAAIDQLAHRLGVSRKDHRTIVEGFRPPRSAAAV
jgi:hypothetical protein